MGEICELVVLEGSADTTGQVFWVHDDQRPTMGRSSACDFVVDDDQLSGIHCQFMFRDGWTVRDLLSRNGLHVNDQLIDQHQLKPGDTIRLGNTVLSFALSGGGDQPTAPSKPKVDVELDRDEQVDPLRQTRVKLGGDQPEGATKPLGRLISKRTDLELAKLALKNDLLSHEQLRECVEIQKEMLDVKIHMTLEEIFQEREYLTRDQIQSLTREYKYTRRRTKDLLYAEVARGNKLVDEAKIQACLDLQAQSFETGDKIPYLGELLVKQGYISIRDNNRVIRAIKAYKEEDKA